MRKALIFGFVAALALPAIPQDLPPGVLLFSQIKRHVEQQLKDLQNYTCLETIHRFHSVAGLASNQKPEDTLRLEVLYAGKKELFSMPGERNFSQGDPGAYVSSGLNQDGLFGGYLHNVVASGAALETYRGEEHLAGRLAAKYDYRISSFLEPLKIDLGPAGQGTVGITGAFWADPVSKDVLRLDIRPDDIPPSLPVASALWVIRFARVRIREGEIMVPQSVDSRLELTSGQVERNIVELTHCRAFEAESSISFTTGEPKAPDAGTRPLLPGAAFAESFQPIRAGLHVTVSLTTPVNEMTPVGTPIEARIVGAAAPKGGIPVIPDGAAVHGRVREVEHEPGAGDTFRLAIEFCDVEVNGAPQRFFADLEGAGRAPGIDALIAAGNSSPDSPPALPGVAYFVLHQGSAGLPRGFTTVWKTASLNSGTADESRPSAGRK